MRLVYIYIYMLHFLAVLAVEGSDFLNYSVIKKHQKKIGSLCNCLLWVLSPRYVWDSKTE